MARRALDRSELEQLTSIWKSPGFLPTIIAVGAAFGSWSLLLPVVPLAVIREGGSEALAGASTGVFMVLTVITQICTPALLRKFGYTPVMAVSAFLLGVPALGYLFGIDPLPLLVFSAIRGIGFGSLTVAESALIAELVPLRFLGKATGTLGLAVGVAELLCLPLGLYLADHFGFDLVYILGAAVALLAALMCLAIPHIKPEPVAKKTPKQASTEVAESPELLELSLAPEKPVTPHVATWKLVTVPALGIFVVAMGFGAVSNFLPAAVRESDPANGAIIAGIVLALVGGSQMATRYIAGVVADRSAVAGATMLPGLLASSLGLALMAATITQGWPAWVSVIAALLFGGGFGAVQNEALLTMFSRMPRERVSEASALWNISFDSGTGMGSFVLGFVAGRMAYGGAFWTGALIVGLGIVLTWLDREIGKHRIAETGNIRERLRRLPRLPGPRRKPSSEADPRH